MLILAAPHGCARSRMLASRGDRVVGRRSSIDGSCPARVASSALARLCVAIPYEVRGSISRGTRWRVFCSFRIYLRMRAFTRCQAATMIAVSPGRFTWSALVEVTGTRIRSLPHLRLGLPVGVSRGASPVRVSNYAALHLADRPPEQFTRRWRSAVSHGSSTPLRMARFTWRSSVESYARDDR